VKGEVVQINNNLILCNTKEIMDKAINGITKDRVSCIPHVEQLSVKPTTINLKHEYLDSEISDMLGEGVDDSDE
jgi:hypothetical protein